MNPAEFPMFIFIDLCNLIVNLTKLRSHIDVALNNICRRFEEKSINKFIEYILKTYVTTNIHYSLYILLLISYNL